MQAFLKTVWQRRLAALSLGGLFAATPLLAQSTVPELPPALKQPPLTTPPVTPTPLAPAPTVQPVAPQPTPELRPGLRDAIERNRATREANRDNRQDAREENRDTRELNRDTRTNSIEPGARADDRQDRRERAINRLGFALNAATNGLRVENTQPNSAFGFRNNDVVLRVGETRFNNNAAFFNWLTTAQPGQRFGITVLRDGREETVNWTPTEQWSRDFNADYQHVAADQGTLGITIDAENSQAAIVAQVAPGSLADRAGIRPRDQIDSLNGEKIRTAQEFLMQAARVDGKAQIDVSFTRVVTLNSVAKPLTEITVPLPDRRDAPSTLPMPVTPRPPQPNVPRIDPSQANPGVTPVVPRP